MDDDLRAALHACKRILTKLQLIDDAPTSHLRQGPKPPRYAEALIPEGVAVNQTVNGADRAPAKGFSLYAYYLWHMKRAQANADAAELNRLTNDATYDYEIHIGARRPSLHESHESAVIELLRDYAGVPSTDAAWRLRVDEKWVRRQRVLEHRDPDVGNPRENDQRMKQIVRLKTNGATLKTIAAEVNLSTGQVSNLLNGRTSSHATVNVHPIT